MGLILSGLSGSGKFLAQAAVPDEMRGKTFFVSSAEDPSMADMARLAADCLGVNYQPLPVGKPLFRLMGATDNTSTIVTFEGWREGVCCWILWVSRTGGCHLPFPGNPLVASVRGRRKVWSRCGGLVCHCVLYEPEINRLQAHSCTYLDSRKWKTYTLEAVV